MSRVLRVAFWCALAVQLFALYLYRPGDGPPLAVPHVDKLVHIVIFMVPAALGILARLPALLVVVTLAVHAPASELVQHIWLPEREGDAWDVLADWAGVVLGLAAGKLLLKSEGEN